MTRAKWLEALQLENISPLLDECNREKAYEIFHAMAQFHREFIMEVWKRFDPALVLPRSTSCITRTKPTPAQAIEALDALMADGGISIMPIPSTDKEFEQLHKLLGD